MSPHECNEINDLGGRGDMGGHRGDMLKKAKTMRGDMGDIPFRGMSMTTRAKVLQSVNC